MEVPMTNYQFQPRERMVFDGKRMRKPIVRKIIDYAAPCVKYALVRSSQRGDDDYSDTQPHPAYFGELLPPMAWHNPATSICSHFVHTSTNKVRCPVNDVLWTPDGRRLITGSSSGEFTLWNGISFNFETILQAHDSAVRRMIWSFNENWMVSGDAAGWVKYWQSNMNNVKAFEAHKEAIRDLSFSPTDMKFASASDDVTIKVWDFERCEKELTLTGHGWDVKAVSWHPSKSLLVSGSKDNLIKMWDPKSGKNLATLYGHKNTVLQTKWNANGNWMISASRDQLLKLWDLRTLKELEVFRGHKREVTCVEWHPYHQDSFVSGGFDGDIIYWNVGSDEPQAHIYQAHESSVWTMSWHPIGHTLCTGSNDHTTKFWSRNRPGEVMDDKFNVNMDMNEPAGIAFSAPQNMGNLLPHSQPNSSYGGGFQQQPISLPGLSYQNPIPQNMPPPQNMAPPQNYYPQY